MRRPAKPAPFPTRQQVLEFIRSSETRIGKRELARAFNVGVEQRPALRALLKSLEQSGEIERGQHRRFAGPGAMPEVAVLQISGTDADGELLAKPLTWTADGPPPRILMAPAQRGEAPLGQGDRVLAKLRRLKNDLYEGRAIRRLTTGPARVLGVYALGADGHGRLRPTDRRQKSDFAVADAAGARPGDLVLAEILPAGRPHTLRPARIIECLGSMDDPRSISLMAIAAADIPDVFSAESLSLAAAAGPAPIDGRVDLRDIPLITIDGEDARDFDDAVWAEAIDGGGWHLIVAIADVAWYVRPGDALDKEAFRRGNSVYFPDRVVPMLPEALSNGWCSLKPAEDRPCLAVHIWIDGAGNKSRHQFVRAMIRSAARLTYDQVQAAIDGDDAEPAGPLRDSVLKPLYGAWKALFAERERRGVLDLDLPERKVVIGDDGRVERVVPRPRHDSHKLIEDFMIAANVAAAEQIEARRAPCMYRVHDLPSSEKLEGLRDFVSTLGLSLAKGQVLRAAAFNGILAAVKDTPQSHLVSEVVLRSQAQAAYSPENIGHFGLGLARYAHFTSPIRRYADLLVHRALVGELPGDAIARFAEIGEHISATERRAAQAERDALDRFTARFLADRVGATFSSRIRGVTRFGLFVTLDETGADGLIPVSSLPGDYYEHDSRNHCLVGQRTRTTFTLGDSVVVELVEANAVTGGLVFRLKASSQTEDKPRRSHLAPPGRIRRGPRR